jgi:hypothetical protein
LKNQTLAPSVGTQNRILVRGVNWLGDAVMTTPALRRLREFFPEAHISLLTHEKLAELWLRFPGIDEVLTFKSGESPWSLGKRLRAFAREIIRPGTGFAQLAKVRLGGVASTNSPASRLCASVEELVAHATGCCDSHRHEEAHTAANQKFG